MNYSSSMRLCITMPAELVQQLETVAKQRYTTHSELLRQAFLEWLEHHIPSGQTSASSKPLPTEIPDQEPSSPSVLLHPTTNRPLPRYGEVAFKDLIEPGMSGEELLELLERYEQNV